MSHVLGQQKNEPLLQFAHRLQKHYTLSRIYKLDASIIRYFCFNSLPIFLHYLRRFEIPLTWDHLFEIADAVDNYVCRANQNATLAYKLFFDIEASPIENTTSNSHQASLPLSTHCWIEHEVGVLRYSIADTSTFRGAHSDDDGTPPSVLHRRVSAPCTTANQSNASNHTKNVGQSTHQTVHTKKKLPFMQKNENSLISTENYKKGLLSNESAVVLSTDLGTLPQSTVEISVSSLQKQKMIIVFDLAFHITGSTSLCVMYVDITVTTHNTCVYSCRLLHMPYENG